MCRPAVKKIQLYHPLISQGVVVVVTLPFHRRVNHHRPSRHRGLVLTQQQRQLAQVGGRFLPPDPDLIAETMRGRQTGQSHAESIRVPNTARRLHRDGRVGTPTMKVKRGWWWP